MLQQITEIGTKVAVIMIVLTLLPVSPFTGFLYLLNNIPFLGVLNWIIPVGEILAVLEAWLVVVAVYYGILYMINYAGIVKS